jgi:hypothetical protein
MKRDPATSWFIFEVFSISDYVAQMERWKVNDEL